MKKQFEVYQIDKLNNIIIFNKSFFQKFFLMPPLNSTKPLSSLSLRLGFILLNELSFSTWGNIPRRNTLAEELYATQQSVIKSLEHLEQIGFIEREVQIGKKRNAKKKFDGNFRLNFFYNMTENEIIMLNENIKYCCELKDEYNIDDIKTIIKNKIKLLD